MPDEIQYDVFLSHFSKDKAVVRDIAEAAAKGRKMYVFGMPSMQDFMAVMLSFDALKKRNHAETPNG